MSCSDNKLDWTAPLMLDDGKGTGVEYLGLDSAGELHRVRLDGATRYYRSDGNPVYSPLPRIINRPKPDAEQEGRFLDEALLASMDSFTPPAEPVAIDWTKPLEAVRKVGGRVVPVTFLRQAGDTYYTSGAPDPNETNSGWYANGGDCCHLGLWFVRNRLEPTPTPDTVTVPRMTEKEWLLRWHNSGAMELGEHLGLIRPDPTPLDRFTASHPNWRDLDKEEAVRLALEQRGEG